MMKEVNKLLWECVRIVKNNTLPKDGYFVTTEKQDNQMIVTGRRCPDLSTSEREFEKAVNARLELLKEPSSNLINFLLDSCPGMPTKEEVAEFLEAETQGQYLFREVPDNLKPIAVARHALREGVVNTHIEAWTRFAAKYKSVLL